MVILILILILQTLDFRYWLGTINCQRAKRAGECTLCSKLRSRTMLAMLLNLMEQTMSFPGRLCLYHLSLSHLSCWCWYSCICPSRFWLEFALFQNYGFLFELRFGFGFLHMKGINCGFLYIYMNQLKILEETHHMTSYIRHLNLR